jgi:hypothetical protein
VIIRRLADHWYRRDAPGSPYYADLRKGPEGSWQGSIRSKDSHSEVAHTVPFRRLADVREAAERVVADLTHSEKRPGD